MRENELTQLSFQNPDTRKKDFFAALAHRFAVGNSCSHSDQVKTQNQSFCSFVQLILDFHILAFKPHDLEVELPLLKRWTISTKDDLTSMSTVAAQSAACFGFGFLAQSRRLSQTTSEGEKKQAEVKKTTSGGPFVKHLGHNLISGNC